MAAFIDDVMNIRQVTTLSRKESTKNVAFIEVLHSFFCMHRKIFSESVWLDSFMFPICDDTATRCPVLTESHSLFGRVESFRPSFLAAMWTISRRYTWRTSNFGILARTTTLSRGQANSFPVVFIPWID